MGARQGRFGDDLKHSWESKRPSRNAVEYLSTRCNPATYFTNGMLVRWGFGLEHDDRLPMAVLRAISEDQHVQWQLTDDE